MDGAHSRMLSLATLGEFDYTAPGVLRYFKGRFSRGESQSLAHTLVSIVVSHQCHTSMSPNNIQEIAQTLDQVGEDIWCCDDLEDDFDEILQRVSRLEAQLHVQRSLQRTAKLLREQPWDTALPKQLATRVKHFIKFTYEKTNRGKGRPTRLRELGCNDLKFCGLAYKLKDVLDLPATHFEFLVTKVGDFVHRHDLSHLLYRDEIDKAVNNKFDPEDDAIFKEFLKSSSAPSPSHLIVGSSKLMAEVHVDQRPAKRRRVDGVLPSIASHHMADSDGSRIEAEAEQQPGNCKLSICASLGRS